jgi:aryl-alcohol dehydrogenase-like predicted oxidoreductase
VYDAFREAGGNFIDTANLYTNGTTIMVAERIAAKLSA